MREPLALMFAGVRAARWTISDLYRGVKEAHAIYRIDAGHNEWWSNGRTWTSAPGSFQLKQPGDVHRDVRRDGPVTLRIVALDAALITAALRGRRSRPLRAPQLDATDERAAPFARLHDALDRHESGLALEVAVVEAVEAFAAELSGVALDETAPEWRRPVRRAVELMREQLAEPLKLDAIAAHAGLDKFHLSRAFRRQTGLPPHAYLTHLRVLRAKTLLADGARPSDVATQVGLYDQSQLNRHFRRIVGATPGEFARSMRAARG
ncbi:MAG: AraC family transcriptional regulator [Byssovorax sp.]